MAEIDTNYVENKIRDIALGKKNWLFIGNEDCGKIHALWYTLIISSVINKLNPPVYIHYLLTKVHQLRRGEIDPISLLPDRIDIKELECFAAEQVEFGKKMMNAFNSSWYAARSTINASLGETLLSGLYGFCYRWDYWGYTLFLPLSIPYGPVVPTATTSSLNDKNFIGLDGRCSDL